MPGTPLLYHVPPSFYSQVARLVLAEKGVAYEGKLAAAGPPLFETYAPWYLALNPGGTVPTLVHGEVAVPDSREILSYVDEHFEGPALQPADRSARARMQALLEQMYAISIRELSYGSEAGKIGTFANARRLANLRKRARRHPELRELYEAKIRDIEGFDHNSQDAAHVDTLQARVLARLDELDADLGAGGPFLLGVDYSLADVAWTVCVARLRMIKLDPLAGRPALRDWYERMKARPSFAGAGVWERFDAVALAGVLARKLGPYLLAFLALLSLIIYAVWWASSWMA